MKLNIGTQIKGTIKKETGKPDKLIAIEELVEKTGLETDVDFSQPTPVLQNVGNSQQPTTNLKTSCFTDKNPLQEGVKIHKAIEETDEMLKVVGFDLAPDKDKTVTHAFESRFSILKFNPDLPTVNQMEIPSWALHVDCPKCMHQLTDHIIDPQHSIVCCEKCGCEFNVARNCALVIK